MALTSTSVLMVEQDCQNGDCQRLCPQDELQLPPASLGGSLRSAGGCDPGFFQITASAMGPGMCEILCAPCKSGVSISHSPLALLKLSPAGLQSQTFWGFVFLVQGLCTGYPRVGSDPLLLGEELCSCNYPPICGSPT